MHVTAWQGRYSYYTAEIFLPALQPTSRLKHEEPSVFLAHSKQIKGERHTSAPHFHFLCAVQNTKT